MKTAIFYDGYHTILRLQEVPKFKFYNVKFCKVNSKIIDYIKHQFDLDLRICFKGWYQGIVHSHVFAEEGVVGMSKAELLDVTWKYIKDRNLHISLIKDGIEPVFLQSKRTYEEKGVDVALSISAINKVQEEGIECVVLVTNDGDFEPLIHNLNKKGVCTIVVSFQSKKEQCQKLIKRSQYHCVFDEIFTEDDLSKYVLREPEVEYSII